MRGVFCHQVVLVPYGTSGVFCRALLRTHEVILVHGLDHEVEHQVHTDYQHVPQHDVPPPFQFWANINVISWFSPCLEEKKKKTKNSTSKLILREKIDWNQCCHCLLQIYTFQSVRKLIWNIAKLYGLKSLHKITFKIFPSVVITFSRCWPVEALSTRPSLLSGSRRWLSSIEASRASILTFLHQNLLSSTFPQFYTGICGQDLSHPRQY